MNKEFLIMDLDGRLGNQLFIFAAGYALAKELNAELVFSSSKVPSQDLLLPQIVGSLYREATPSELLSVGKYPYQKEWLRKVNRKSINAIRKLQGRKSAIFSKDHTLTFDYDPDVLSLDLPVYISGFFQNEKYFVDYSNEIFDAIWMNLKDKFQALKIPETLDHPLIAVSFRRGEYNSIGWSMPLQFYERALTYLKEYASVGTLLLFSDDLDFVELLEEKWSRSYSVLNALKFGLDPMSQLFLMSNCEHCVISNSTFAWWAAWLGDQKYKNQHRVVIAPEGWLKGGKIYLKDPYQILLDRWIQMPTHRETPQ